MLRNCFRALRTGDDENGERLWGAALGSGVGERGSESVVAVFMRSSVRD